MVVNVISKMRDQKERHKRDKQRLEEFEKEHPGE